MRTTFSFGLALIFGLLVGPVAGSAFGSTEPWYDDAPYRKVKDRYEALINAVPQPGNTTNLKEEVDLAMYLVGEYFKGWTDALATEGKGADQFKKAQKLFEHVVRYYPKNEYRVLWAKSSLAGFFLRNNQEDDALAMYTDLFAIPVNEVVDNSLPTRNVPIVGANGKTSAQLDFEKYIKDATRARTIEIASKRGNSIAATLPATQTPNSSLEHCRQETGVVAPMKKNSKATSAATTWPADYQTRVYSIGWCVQDMIEAGKAQTPRQAEEKILALLTKRLYDLRAGGRLELSPDHRLVATLDSYHHCRLGMMVYPKIALTFFYVLVPRSAEPKLKTLTLPVRRPAVKPVEWKLSETQFDVLLKDFQCVVWHVDKQTVSMNIGDESRRLGSFVEINPSHPLNIPPNHYYTAIQGIDTSCVCRVDPAPNEKEYQISYALHCQRTGHIYTSTGTSPLREIIHCYGTGSFPPDTVLVQRLALTDNPYLNENFLNKEDTDKPKDAFQDPDRDPLFYVVFQIKMVGKPQILQLN